ncbi:hypothetical protein HDV05_007670 [Chytridiales sp. JEL 0842]|nr:hypothetical protein HDV05_007670 [Chytridiales sp. JEL 0842]
MFKQLTVLLALTTSAVLASPPGAPAPSFEQVYHQLAAASQACLTTHIPEFTTPLFGENLTKACKNLSDTVVEQAVFGCVYYAGASTNDLGKIQCFFKCGGECSAHCSTETAERR